MKKLFVLVLLTTLYSCSGDVVQNNCLPFFSLNESINLALPAYIDLQVPSGYTSTTISGRTVLIIKRSSSFKAFDLQCPERDCSKPMTFDGLTMNCSCSGHEYNSLNGSPNNNESSCFAKEYLVEIISSSVIRIRDF